LTKKVTKIKPEELIPEHILNGELTSVKIYFDDNGEHCIKIITTGEIERQELLWDDMTNQEKKLCTDAWDLAVDHLDVEELIESYIPKKK
jgi:hypothetical protein